MVRDYKKGFEQQNRTDWTEQSTATGGSFERRLPPTTVPVLTGQVRERSTTKILTQGALPTIGDAYQTQ